jgi:hypothetical protein
MILRHSSIYKIIYGRKTVFNGFKQQFTTEKPWKKTYHESWCKMECQNFSILLWHSLKIHMYACIKAYMHVGTDTYIWRESMFQLSRYFLVAYFLNPYKVVPEACLLGPFVAGRADRQTWDVYACTHACEKIRICKFMYIYIYYV